MPEGFPFVLGQIEQYTFSSRSPLIVAQSRDEDGLLLLSG